MTMGGKIVEETTLKGVMLQRARRAARRGEVYCKITRKSRKDRDWRRKLLALCGRKGKKGGGQGRKGVKAGSSCIMRAAERCYLERRIKSNKSRRER